MNYSQSEANKEEEAVDALAAQAETQTATLHGTVAVPVGGQPANQAGKRTNHTRMDNENIALGVGGSGRTSPWEKVPYEADRRRSSGGQGSLERGEDWHSGKHMVRKQAHGEAKGYRHGAVMVGERGTHRRDRGKLSYTGVVSVTL